jgi:hypothetical protein
LTAIRSVRSADGKFVQISNTAARDQRLSLRARGVLVFVLSLPPEQHFTAKWLESRVPEGREAVRTALRELEAHGYLRRQRRHAADGRWAWEQVISDAPIAADEGASAPGDGNPYDGKPPDGEPSDKGSNTEPANTNDLKMASRRASFKNAGAKWDNPAIIERVRIAVAEAYGQSKDQELSDEDVLGLWMAYADREGIRDPRAYMARIFADATELDILMQYTEPACLDCSRGYDECECQAALGSAA